RLDELRWNVVMLKDVSLDRFLEMSRNDDQLLDVEPFHRVHDVVHDRSPGDAYQGLRDPLGERQEPRAPSGEGNDDFHVTPVRSGLCAAPRRRFREPTPRAG